MKSQTIESTKDTTLTFSVIGEDRPGVISMIARLTKTNNCSMLSSKLSAVGEAFGFIVHCRGAWLAIAKLESSLQRLATKQDWLIHFKRTHNTQNLVNSIPYYVQVITLDRTGILYELSHFFSKKHIQIDELQCETYLAPKTAVRMAYIHFNIYVCTKTNIASLRDSFMLYSEEHNLDVVIEAIK